MSDVTFEQEVQAWAAFCKRDGIGAVPVSRADVEKHMRQQFVSAATGQPICQDELDLIFDYTCDACESYISIELVGKYGWNLEKCEAFLTGKHEAVNKVRYCSETVKTSLLNLQFASRFDSMALPKSRGMPNLAHLTLSKTPGQSTAQRRHSGQGLPMPTGSFATPSRSLPLDSYSPAVAPTTTSATSATGGNTVSNISPPSKPVVSVSISHPSLPTSLPNQEKSRKLPPHPLHTPLGPPETRHSAPSLPALQSTPTRHSAPQIVSSAPIVPNTAHNDTITSNHSQPKLKTRTSVPRPPVSSDSSSVLDSSKACVDRSSSDGRVKRQVCGKIMVQGFCSPRDCSDSHSPSFTICKWLTTIGSCESHGCPFQHPNLLTREAILGPIFSGTSSVRALSTSEWELLRLTMVFYCPLPMKEKKCSKSGNCKRLNCPKQHKKAPKEKASSKSGSQSSLASASPSASSSSLPLVSSSSNGSLHSNSSSSLTVGSGMSVVTVQGALGGATSPFGASQTQQAPALPPKPVMRLKDVTAQVNHINLVTSIMQGGCAKLAKPLKILKLEEISNSALDEQYRTYFQTTQTVKGGLRPSEIYAFHGAPTGSIQSIASKGFDMSKIRRTKFGHGLYCALDANVSADYCGEGNKLLLVRLITDGLKWVKNPAYYVVQDASSMNPLYIITFERA